MTAKYCLLTSNREDLTDVDSEEAKAARANKTKSLQVQQGCCVLKALETSKLLHTQHQSCPAPVKNAQQGIKTFLYKNRQRQWYKLSIVWN